jgi:hypothetical protein
LRASLISMHTFFLHHRKPIIFSSATWNSNIYRNSVATL